MRATLEEALQCLSILSMNHTRVPQRVPQNPGRGGESWAGRGLGQTCPRKQGLSGQSCPAGGAATGGPQEHKAAQSCREGGCTEVGGKGCAGGEKILEAQQQGLLMV